MNILKSKISAEELRDKKLKSRLRIFYLRRLFILELFFLIMPN
jgi:hypothetical protein